MKMQSIEDIKIIIIKRKTRLEELIARYNTIEQAKFYIEHLGQDFEDYIIDDRTYHASLKQVVNDSENCGKVHVVDRIYVPNFIFSPQDVVIVVGQDGLVANTLKYLNNQLLIGVNPNKKLYDGILLPFLPHEVKGIIKEVIKNQRGVKEIAMAKAVLNDGQEICGVNDLFIGQKSHVSARYTLEMDGHSERQSSSGIIISTGLGSTGWLKSVLQGASNVIDQLLRTSENNVNSKRLHEVAQIKMSWDSEYLMYSVREPFPSFATKTQLTFGKIETNAPLVIKSLMPENGVIFSDGMEEDYLEFTSGKVATICLDSRKGHLVV